MSPSAEFITAIVFAVIMVLIGLGAIWIVRWQTYFLLRHQGKLPDGSSYILPRVKTTVPFLLLVCFSYCVLVVTHLNQVMISSVAFALSTPSKLQESPPSSQPLTQHPEMVP